MAIEWKSGRGLATSQEIDDFEKRNNIRLVDDHRRFLMNILNGGSPVGIAPVPAQHCPGGAGDLSAIWGVNQEQDYWDLDTALSENREFLPALIPFGYDQGNGQLFIDMVQEPGRVVYTPWEELVETRPIPLYHVAMSITEFVALSEELARELDESSS